MDRIPLILTGMNATMYKVADNKAATVPFMGVAVLCVVHKLYASNKFTKFIILPATDTGKMTLMCEFTKNPRIIQRRLYNSDLSYT